MPRASPRSPSGAATATPRASAGTRRRRRRERKTADPETSPRCRSAPSTPRTRRGARRLRLRLRLRGRALDERAEGRFFFFFFRTKRECLRRERRQRRAWRGRARLGVPGAPVRRREVRLVLRPRRIDVLLVRLFSRVRRFEDLLATRLSGGTVGRLRRALCLREPQRLPPLQEARQVAARARPRRRARRRRVAARRLGRRELGGGDAALGRVRHVAESPARGGGDGSRDAGERDEPRRASRDPPSELSGPSGDPPSSPSSPPSRSVPRRAPGLASAGVTALSPITRARYLESGVSATAAAARMRDPGVSRGGDAASAASRFRPPLACAPFARDATRALSGSRGSARGARARAACAARRAISVAA